MSILQIVNVNVMMSMSQYQFQELKTVSVAVLSKIKQIRIFKLLSSPGPKPFVTNPLDPLT